jgi:hypothetical protein
MLTGIDYAMMIPGVDYKMTPRILQLLVDTPPDRICMPYASKRPCRSYWDMVWDLTGYSPVW